MRAVRRGRLSTDTPGCSATILHTGTGDCTTCRHIVKAARDHIAQGCCLLWFDCAGILRIACAIRRTGWTFVSDCCSQLSLLIVRAAIGYGEWWRGDRPRLYILSAALPCCGWGVCSRRGGFLGQRGAASPAVGLESRVCAGGTVSNQGRSCLIPDAEARARSKFGSGPGRRTDDRCRSPRKAGPSALRVA